MQKWSSRPKSMRTAVIGFLIFLLVSLAGGQTFYGTTDVNTFREGRDKEFRNRAESPLLGADFEKFAGKLAKLKMKPDFQGPKALNGRIVKVEGVEITFDDRIAGELAFPYESVAKANLKIDIEQELNRR